MALFARHISAVLVVIAMIAAQMMPAWAGCHSQRHAPGAVIAASAQGETADVMGNHHAMSTATDLNIAASDQTQPASSDVCLGNCGCACGLSGAFVLANVMAIGAPHGVVQNLTLTSIDMPLGDRPDGPRRPPRTTA